MDIKALIREIPDFPKPGIQFKDITTLLRDAKGLQYAIDTLAEKCASLNPDYIIGMESRGLSSVHPSPISWVLGLFRFANQANFPLPFMPLNTS